MCRLMGRIVKRDSTSSRNDSREICSSSRFRAIRVATSKRVTSDTKIPVFCFRASSIACTALLESRLGSKEVQTSTWVSSSSSLVELPVFGRNDGADYIAENLAFSLHKSVEIVMLGIHRH